MKTTEDFLRKWFGLKGEFYTKEWRSIIEAEFDREKFLSYDGDIYTEEADQAWYKATDLIDDLLEMGIIDEETRDRIAEGFCDRA